jgi:hypothetical protein
MVPCSSDHLQESIQEGTRNSIAETLNILDHEVARPKLGNEATKMLK